MIYPYEHLLQTLIMAQKERHLRNRPDPNGELGWIIYERQVMFNAVNAERLGRGLCPITIDRLLKAERMAIGHSDYTTKLALYCHELAIA